MPTSAVAAVRRSRFVSLDARIGARGWRGAAALLLCGETGEMEMPALPVTSAIRIVVSALLGVAAIFAGPTRAADPFELEWRQLDDGVWAGIRPNSPRSPATGTTVIVIGEDGVLLFDPAGFPLQGERVLAKVKELTDLPVTHMAISHWHGDHHLGLYKILEEYPDAEIITHEFTAKALKSPLMNYINDVNAEALESVREQSRKIVETGKAPDGSPVGEKRLAANAEFLEYFDLLVAQLSALVIPVPTQTMKDRLDIDLGGRIVELRHIAPGNTKGDMFLYLPKERILATGDIVVRPTPYGFGSYPRSWVEVLRQLKTFDAKTIVPGHGDIQTDFSYFDLLIEALTLVAGQVEPLAREGKSLDEVREKIDLSPVEERFTGGDEILTGRFEAWFRTPITEATFNLATGKDNENLEAGE